MEVLYYYKPNPIASKGDWIKLGRSYHLKENKYPYVFKKSDLEWPASNVVKSANAILGQNGAGKTTALLEIFYSLPFGGTIQYGSAFLVKNLNSVYLIKHRECDVTVAVEGKEVIVLDTKKNIEEIKKLLFDVQVIFLDTVIRNQIPHINEYTNAIDVSSSGLLAKDGARSQDQAVVDFRSFIVSEFQRDIRFFASREFKKSNIVQEVNIPTELSIESNMELSRRFLTVAERMVSNKRADQLSDLFWKPSVKYLKGIQNYDEFEAISWTNFLGAHLLDCSTNSLAQGEIAELLQSLFDDELNSEAILKKCLATKLLKVGLEKKIENMKLFLHALKGFPVAGRDGGSVIRIQAREKIERLFSYYVGTYSITPHLNFRWRGMSSGESALLKVFSRLFHAREELKGNSAQCKTIIILMDEPDTHLHPNWERKLLDEMIRFCEGVFDGLNIQLVFTTNKPFCLSDLTSENITILNRDGISAPKFETFCNRIPSILANGFFLKDDLGDISRRFLEDIKNQKTPLSEFQQRMVSRVGDPYLKSAIERYLENDIIENR